MVGIALFGHEDAIHAQGHISKDGEGKIVNAVGVSGIFGIGNSQIGFQSLIPSRRIGQAHFDLKPGFVEIVVIVRGRDGKGDGLYSRQGGLKHHVPGRFVPVIHLRHIKQIERHDADCPRRLTACPFYSVSGHGPRPLFGVHLGLRGVHPRFAHSHACGLAKNRALFHIAALFQMGQHPGLQQTRGRVHLGIARHGGLAKNRSPYLIRRDEPPSGALLSNAILRFEKADNAYHVFSQSKDIPYALSGSFIGVLGGAFGLVFSGRPGQGGGFAFQPAGELLASIGPGVGQTLSSLNILKSRLGLLYYRGPASLINSSANLCLLES